MKEITIEEFNQLANSSSETSVLVNETEDKTNSMVILQECTSGFVLRVSCGTANLLKIFFSENFEDINQSCQNYVGTLKEKANPFLDNGLSKEQLIGLATQLGKPEGEAGVHLGHMMNETNISMTRASMTQLSITDKDQILELGHGNANHLAELFDQAKDLIYVGLDISESMKIEAEKYSLENKLEDSASFYLYDGTNIPFEDNAFEKIFTVNTLYFWQNPVDLFNELYRVLKPNGRLCITFVDQETMEKLSFTEYGFVKYNQTKFADLASKSKFQKPEAKLFTEMIKNKLLGEMERKFWIMTLTKS